MKSTKTNFASGTVRSLSHDGRGIASSDDNRVIFIAGALPDEQVNYRIVKKHRKYLEAEVTAILQAAPERVMPPCPHFSDCGGCSLQHMTMDAQIAFKQQLLLDQLKSLGQVTPNEILPSLVAETLGYRRKARLGVKWVDKKDKLLIGFREKSSHHLAELDTCLVLHPRVGGAFDALKTLISALSVCRHIPQIEVAVGDVEVALIFRCLMPLKETDQALLIAFGATHKIDIYIAQNPPQPLIQLHQGGREERLTYTLPNENLVFLFHPLDFTQIHLEMNRLMVAQAMSLLAVSPNDDVLDLYCGIGNFTLPLAKRAAKVVGVEGSKEMVLRAYENAQHNHIDNVQYFAANLELPNPESPWAKNRYHKLLLDPPRVGAKDVLPLVDVWQPEQILYISCNSATLARDAGLLVHTHKYHLQKGGIMNMFPHTSHVEAMALFKRKK